jgi:hypothetical protein
MQEGEAIASPSLLFSGLTSNVLLFCLPFLGNSLNRNIGRLRFA